MLLSLALPSVPQGLTFGANGGLRLSGEDPPSGGLFASNSRRYLVGPIIEVGLPFHFAFEVDALYSRLGNTFYIPQIGDEFDIRTIANSWAFPLLVKYRLPGRRIRPFLSAGIAPRYANGGIHTINYFGVPTADVAFSSASWNAHDYALASGGGIDNRLGHIRISPALRYLRWHVPSTPSPNDTAYY